MPQGPLVAVIHAEPQQATLVPAEKADQAAHDIVVGRKEVHFHLESAIGCMLSQIIEAQGWTPDQGPRLLSRFDVDQEGVQALFLAHGQIVL
jgi:hypothetical protein